MTSAILIVFILIFAAVPVVSAESDDSSSYYYIVIDQDTGAVLLGQNSDARIFPASTTKILTAFTALANSGITTVVTASAKAVGPMESGAVRLPLSEGEQMQMYDMLNALLLRSANDVAVAIAENIGGTVENFSNMMNEKAADAGALDTHFTNPHGLHDDEHYTTPYDLAMITRKALENYAFTTIVGKYEYTLPASNKRTGMVTLRNSNPILGQNDGTDFLVTGVKTGYTSKAKYTLVSAAHDYTGRELICVVANMPSRAASAELSLGLMKKAFEEFSVQPVAYAGQILTGRITDEFDYPVASAMGLEYLMPRNESLWKLSTRLAKYAGADNNPEKGEIVGAVTYIYNGVEIGSSYIVAAESRASSPSMELHKITDFGPETRASFPLRFLIPLSLAVISAALFFFSCIRYNEKQVKE
ncbi:MAG: D-alanyl-D-alanine carboxypeptidase family protein [Clostridia bacterium]